MRFHVELRFGDGTSVVRDVDLAVAAEAPAAQSQSVLASIPSELDATSIDLVIEAAADAIVNHCFHRGIDLIDDPRSALGGDPPATPSRSAVSEVQVRKYERFVATDAHVEAILATQQVIDLDGLERSEIGRTWGITVCPDRHVLVRLNVGRREVMTIRPDGSMRLYLVGDPNELDRAPGPTTSHRGMGGLPDSHAVGLPIDQALQWLDQSRTLSSQHRRLVEQSTGPPIRRNWHNPLVEQLLQSVPGRGRA